MRPPVAPPTAETVVTRLEAILHARAAAAALETDLPNDSGHVVLLPGFAMAAPALNVGNKALTKTALHHRLRWSAPLVVLVDEAQPEPVLGWETSSLGHTLRGEYVARRRHGERYRSADQLRRILQRTVGRGTRERVSLVHAFEPFVRTSVEKANFSLSQDMGVLQQEQLNNHCDNLLDDEAVDNIVTNLVYGDNDSASEVDKLVTQSLEPGGLDRCDIDRLFRYGVWSRSRAAVQRAIGDPHIGPKIRKLARSMGPDTSLGELLDEYRRLYPREHLSWERAHKALVPPLAQVATFAADTSEMDRRTAADSEEL